MDKPILFLDVDGPLNPWDNKLTQRPEGYVTHRTRPANTVWADTRNKPLRVWLNPLHGPELLKLSYELVWATTWVGEANVWIGPHVGLPQLPVVEFPNGGLKGQIHWKTRHLIEYADGRPFVWVDDECSVHDSAVIAHRHGDHGKTFRVSPKTGLTEFHFKKLADLF